MQMMGIRLAHKISIRTRFRTRKQLTREEEGGSRWTDWFNTGLGRMVRGIIKLAIAGLIITLVSQINFSNVSITIGSGSATIPVGTIGEIIVAFVPLLIIVSALHDLGINI